MEATTPFDLNHEITQWRAALEQSPAFRRENLDELEAHVRDSVGELQPRGLSEEEAFLVAVRRVGSAAKLGAEFGKINSPNVWLNRVLWMLLGIQFYHGFVNLTGAASVVTTWLGLKSVLALDMSLNPVLVGLAGAGIHLLFGAAVLIGCWRILNEKQHGLSVRFQELAPIFRRPGFFVLACVAIILASLTLALCGPLTSVLLVRTLAAQHPHAWMACNWGYASARAIQSAALALLTLWLARRQWLAKA